MAYCVVQDIYRVCVPLMLSCPLMPFANTSGDSKQVLVDVALSLAKLACKKSPEVIIEEMDLSNVPKEKRLSDMALKISHSVGALHEPVVHMDKSSFRQLESSLGTPLRPLLGDVLLRFCIHTFLVLPCCSLCMHFACGMHQSVYGPHTCISLRFLAAAT